MRTVLCLGLVFAVCVVAMAEQTFQGSITAIEGGKVTFKSGMFDKETKKFVQGEPVTLPVASNVKVVKGAFNKETKKLEAGEAIEGGLKAEMFSKIGDKGVRATITTDGEGDKPSGKITQIMIFGGRKGKGK